MPRFNILSQVSDFTRYTVFRRPREDASPPSESSTKLLYYSLPDEYEDVTGAVKASDLRSLLDDAAIGDCTDQAQFIQSMVEKDNILAAHFETRKTTVNACDVSLRQPGLKAFQKNTDTRINDFLKELQDVGLRELVDHLLDAIPTGYAGSIINWGSGGRILGFTDIHPTVWNFDLYGSPALKSPANSEVTPLHKFHPDQFVLHTFRLKPGTPAIGGWGRALVWMFYFKHEAWKSWARFLEKFGIPTLIAKMSDADFENTSKREALAKQLRRVAIDGVIVTTEESPVEVQTVAGTHNQIHQEYVDKIDRGLAISVLGQLASSEGEQGRLGNNEEQQQVRQDKKEADCRGIMATLQAQVINPAWRFRYGNEPPPEFQMDFARADDLEKRAAWVKTLSEAGYHVAREQIAHDFAIELDENTEPTKGTNADPDANDDGDEE